MNLCRAVLSIASESESTVASFSANEFPECPSNKVKEHAYLLEDAGLIYPQMQNFGPSCTIRLTWADHDFLDLADTVSPWKNLFDNLVNAGVPLTLDLAVGLPCRLISQSKLNTRCLVEGGMYLFGKSEASLEARAMLQIHAAYVEVFGFLRSRTTSILTDERPMKP